ncbi:MAG: PH domain-containing protein [Mycobacteriales bacterium]|nr:PH domain-containing protein [Mycobacteriales bacterium]
MSGPEPVSSADHEGPGAHPGELRVDPPRRITALAGLAGLVAVAALVVSDTGGRLLVVPVLLGAAAFVVRDLICGPLLRADGEGLDVLDGARRVRVPWGEVERVRVVKDRRTPVLEVDTGHRVVALSGTRLGQHPADVVEALEAHRARWGG